MKKWYIICFFAIGILFSAAYYTSYRITMDKVEMPSIAENKTTVPATYIAAENVKEATIQNNTIYVIEEYSLLEKTFSQEVLEVPTEILGFTRKKLTDYIQQYMETLPEEEKKAGLISYELTTFSEDKVILRKTYAEPEPEYIFYLDVQMGRVIVRQTADNALYAYTEIKFADLPENLKQEILIGKYMESIEELYEFLEAYSS